MDVTLDRFVRRLRRRAALAAWLGDWSRHLTIALFAAGAIALLARAIWHLDPKTTALAFAFAVPTVATAWLTARRRFLSRRAATTWVDLHTGSTGLVCTSDEIDDPRWNEAAAARLARRNGALSLPSLRGRRLAAPPLCATAFAAATLWVPLPERVLPPGRELFERSLDELTEKLATLEEEITVDERTADELRSSLERIDDELTDASAESVLEALDRLDGRLGEAAEDARRRAEESLARLDQASRAEPDDAGELAADDDPIGRALAELAELGLLDELPNPPELGALSDLASRDDLAALSERLALDPAALEALSAELAELFEGKLDQLAAAGLLESARPRKAGELARFAELVEHECDEDCERKPGGT